MEKTPSATAVTAWVKLVRGHRAAMEQVEGALKAAGLPPLAWYDVLLELEQTSETGLRPFELQERLLLPQYSMSRLLARMAGAGLIDQRHCNDDGRGQQVVITESGRAMRRNMWPVYGAAVQKAIGDRLSLRQVRELAILLAKLA